MRIKKFTLMLLAVLFSTVGFAQKSFSVKKDIAFNRQTKVLTMESLSKSVAANATSATSRKARSKAAEVVTPPASGDVEYYTLTGTNYRSGGETSRQVKVVWDDDDMDVLYIAGLSYYLPNAFVKATFISDEDVVIESGQYFGSYGGEYDMYFVAVDPTTSEIRDAQVTFDGKKGTFTFSDILLDAPYPNRTNYYAYWSAGLVLSPLEGEPVIPVEIPRDLEIETYAYTAYDGFDEVEVSGNVNIGVYGDELYIQGMSTDYPEAWIRGTFENDTTIVFPSGQLLSDEDELYFVAIDDNFDVTDSYTLIYEPSTGIYYEGPEAPVINAYKDRIDHSVWQYYYNYEIRPITEKAATPAKSVVSGLAFTQKGDKLEFGLAKVDVDGEGLVADKLTYKLWYATEEGTESVYTFTKDVYTSLEAETDEIPATFTDDNVFADGSLTLLAEDRTSWVRIGIQTIYYGGDERNEGEIGWYSPVWPVTVTLPEGLTVTEHALKVEQYGQEGNVTVEKTVGLAFSGNDMYIRGIGDANDDAWIKGTKNADGDYVFAKGQDLGNYGSAYRLFFVGFDGDGNASDVTVSVNTADGVYEFLDEYRENASYTDKSYYLNRFLSGATITIAEAVEEIPEVVEVPEDLKTEPWSFVGTDFFDDNDAIVSRSVNVGFDGDDVYVQGLSEALPEAWVKGIVEDDVVTFPAGQFLGQYRGYDLWFLGWNTNSGTVFDYVMEYDVENGIITNTTEAEAIGINIYKNRISGSLFESYVNTKITKVTERVATPAKPSADHIGFTPYGDVLEFSIPTVDTNLDGLVDSLISYKLYYDEGDGEAKEVTFTTDLYKYLTEDLTTVPYGFLDYTKEDGSYSAYDFGASFVYLNMDYSTWTRVGIQSIYRGGGETNASEIGWYTITRPQTIELPEGAEVAVYNFVGTDVNNVEISKSVNVAKVGDDVYVQGIGTRNAETWIKGTKDAETGVYTFAKGQYLGLFSNSTQTDYSYLYLMGYNSTFETVDDVLMTYDEENDIFTTTTELVENADYVDKLYYLTRINPGAQIMPIPNVAAVPAAPAVDAMAHTPYGTFIEFTVPAEDVDGNAIIDSLLSYKLYYVDAEGTQGEVTFTTDLYKNLEVDQTEIPYGFTDEWDFYDGAVYLNMEISDWQSIGIQSIYKGGDETNASEIDWYTVIKPQVVSLPEGAEVQSYGFVATNNSGAEYTVGGLKVAFVEDDVYVQGISTIDSETWIKGTKDEQGVYTFALGQYLGLAQDSRGNYSNGFLLGYYGGATEFKMTLDEETGILTSTTLLIENADYVDVANPISYFLVGAQLIPSSTPDAIAEINAEGADGGVRYNIAGQLVGKNYKGIVVKDGKKILQK